MKDPDYSADELQRLQQNVKYAEENFLEAKKEMEPLEKDEIATKEAWEKQMMSPDKAESLRGTRAKAQSAQPAIDAASAKLVQKHLMLLKKESEAKSAKDEYENSTGEAKDKALTVYQEKSAALIAAGQKFEAAVAELDEAEKPQIEAEEMIKASQKSAIDADNLERERLKLVSSLSFEKIAAAQKIETARKKAEKAATDLQTIEESPEGQAEIEREAKAAAQKRKKSLEGTLKKMNADGKFDEKERAELQSIRGKLKQSEEDQKIDQAIEKVQGYLKDGVLQDEEKDDLKDTYNMNLD